MCITTPAKVLAVKGNQGVVELNGRTKVVRLDLVSVKPGDWVYTDATLAIENAPTPTPDALAAWKKAAEKKWAARKKRHSRTK